jgi:hypothetical protein
MAEFHAWIYDIQTKEDIDYDTTEPALIEGYLKKINKMYKTEKYTKNDISNFYSREYKPNKYIKKAISSLKREYKKSPQDINDYKTDEGGCLKRAVIIHLQDPKRYKICVGSLSVTIDGYPHTLWNYYDI